MLKESLFFFVCFSFFRIFFFFSLFHLYFIYFFIIINYEKKVSNINQLRSYRCNKEKKLENIIDCGNNEKNTRTIFYQIFLWFFFLFLNSLIFLSTIWVKILIIETFKKYRMLYKSINHSTYPADEIRNFTSFQYIF